LLLTFNAINSNVGIMHHHLPEDSPLLQNLDHITHASNHALELTHILKIYTQRKTANHQFSNLPGLLAPLIKTFADTLPGHIRLRDESSNANHDVIVCPAMFEQAVTGILQNAVDALGGKAGEIHIATSNDCSHVAPEEGLFYGMLPTERATMLEIRDTGEGIEPTVLEHILEPCFSTRIRGRGLGLTPAVGLVFHFNAAIQILSAPARGTAMRLLLQTAE